MYLENTEFHPSLCWTLQRKSQSLQLCNTIYICLPLGKKNQQQNKREDKKVSADLQHSLKKKKKHPAIVSSCILDEKLQGLIVSGDILGPQDGQKYSQIQ